MAKLVMISQSTLPLPFELLRLIMHSAALGLSLALLPTVFAATYVVSVGADGKFAYDPQYITAHSGDIVNFIL